ncbi:hypothetical protein HTZ84_20965 [Haloterrigena sp. SYSU A558-1]|uniref:Uncharacterized protein n=1 Tax=Haloterrigena gelatinilytica TaxID=2741724 RepID=A0ABX2LLR9_9EURY|nr:hypothetical protein [Haloterrigena gelatinilytica]NUC74736.1 hypothetical protein [Haloterrigena gelatinilytica]
MTGLKKRIRMRTATEILIQRPMSRGRLISSGGPGNARPAALHKVMIIASVTQILRDHGLTPENAKQFVALSPLYNKKDLAEQMGVSEVSVHRYKQIFWDMQPEQRYRVMAALMTEKYNEVVDSEPEETTE